MVTDQKPSEDKDLERPAASCCGSNCSCHDKGSAGKTRWIVGVVVLAAAGALVARAVVKNNSAPDVTTAAGFAALPVVAQAATANGIAPVLDTNVVKELSALSDLNTAAKDMDGVFVYLPGKTNDVVKEAFVRIRIAAETIERQTKGKIGVFALKMESRDYEQVVKQITVPGAIAMVKGKGMVPVTGDITEAKLIQAFVSASSAGGCGPSSGGCGPKGCN